MTLLMDSPVAAKSNETTLRADIETASVVRAAAALRGMSIAEYLRVEMLPIARKAISDAADGFPKAELPKAARKSK